MKKIKQIIGFIFLWIVLWFVLWILLHALPTIADFPFRITTPFVGFIAGATSYWLVFKKNKQKDFTL
jgi:thiol:disulfide interchange protein